MTENCPKCGTRATVVKKFGVVHHSADKKLREVLKQYKVPFVCSTCGGIQFRMQALKGVVFLWPEPVKEKQGRIVIPEMLKELFKTSIGVVLSSGPGCKEKRTGRYVASELLPGDLVFYDKSIPWHMDIAASDGKMYDIPFMNILDIVAKPTED